MTQHLKEHRELLSRAAAGQLPDHVDRTTDVSVTLLRELVEGGFINAIDANSMDGLCYLNPRITIQGREYLRTLDQRAEEASGSTTASRVNWVRAFNRLFEMINASGPTYFSGPRFITKVREVDPYFPNYHHLMEQRQKEGKSTSRSEYFYEIFLSFNETQRLALINAVLLDVRDHMPEKVAGLEAELGVVPQTEQLTNNVLTSTPLPAPAVPVKDKQSTTKPIEAESQPLSVSVRSSAVKEFWNKHWQWVIGTAIAFASVFAAFIKG